MTWFNSWKKYTDYANCDDDDQQSDTATTVTKDESQNASQLTTEDDQDDENDTQPRGKSLKHPGCINSKE